MYNLSQSEFTFKRDLSIFHDDLLYCKCRNYSEEDLFMSNSEHPENEELTFTCREIRDDSFLEKNNYKIEYTSINAITPKAVNLSVPHVELEAPHEVWIPLSVLRNHDPEDKTVYVWSVFADENLEGFIQ